MSSISTGVLRDGLPGFFPLSLSIVPESAATVDGVIVRRQSTLSTSTKAPAMESRFSLSLVSRVATLFHRPMKANFLIKNFRLHFCSFCVKVPKYYLGSIHKFS